MRLATAIANRRLLNLAGLLACAGMMGFALYVQHVLYYDPCPLCVLQRIAVISMGAIFLVATVHGTDGAFRWVYAALIGLAGAGGAGVAARHVWLQHLPADKVPSCGPGFDYLVDTLPLADALKKIFSGSGECANVDWSLLGLSMPAWVLIAVVPLALFGIWANARRAPRRW
ncbi:MAG: disulfide bond formation protein B [Gammaproteobacteria bacterium]|nr:disulfide bond formation protein B [Gammaproteobacteria bacterium]MDH4252955.1 disulfide bond formation protein B [Gammaproteobacteria bacterium]MDH5308359.1 disulfide bond formation protein B [Gammaproteobacteria bacterium]